MFKRLFIYVLTVFTVVSLSGCGDTSNPTLDNETTMYKISFDSGDGSKVDLIEISNGVSIDLPFATRTGYSFLGWTQTDNENAEPVIEPFSTDSDITLYAKWSFNQYTVSFNTNGGSFVNAVKQDYKTDILEPDNPEKAGYTFDGWYQDEDLSREYVFTTMSSEDITLYAKWNVDWSEIDVHLRNLFSTELSDNIFLPTAYQEYTISWDSNNPEVLSDKGFYTRPYQPSTVTLTANIEYEHHTLTKTYDVKLVGYKSLSAPLLSSYIYRGYHTVTDSFFTTLDIINCAFITADANGELYGTTVLDNISKYIMPKARETGNWVLFSIAPNSDWSEIASKESTINTFADNIVSMINMYGFDGVDIDWETPTIHEAHLFTEMMEVIYTKVKANNPNHLVTAAIAGGKWQPPRYDLVNSHQYLDYINMMTYGMVSNNGYYQNALYESKEFVNPTYEAGRTLTSCSIEESVEIYNSFGIPNNKIIVGVAFYGIKQTRTFDVGSQSWSDWTKLGSVSYTVISNNYLNNDDYKYYYDKKAGVPYIIKTDGTLFISYDNPRSIADKSEFIIENGLAGMMYWENGHDSTGTLILAMEVGLND